GHALQLLKCLLYIHFRSFCSLFFRFCEKSGFNHADLEGADLRGADLSNAYLSNANLRGANLCGANLTSAKISDEQLALAKTNWMTVRPNGKRGLL
ncbi:pentapeptide repeat-containing protein, partial [Nostoc sp.]|uniref:pentapeptide repeat-containing protein n=1 Tax=Nostoc sp. TaxID=1180 RepID=UPI002FFC9BA6